MTKHHEKRKSKTTDWITPPWVYQALGKFDLDPCGHPSSPTAEHRLILPHDGLVYPWPRKWRVWLNPPYGDGIDRWLEKLAEHGSGTALLPARTETRWFQAAAEACTAALFVKKRIAFLTPEGLPVDGNTVGSVLLAYGERDARALRRSGIEGWPVRRERRGRLTQVLDKVLR